MEIWGRKNSEKLEEPAKLETCGLLHNLSGRKKWISMELWMVFISGKRRVSFLVFGSQTKKILITSLELLLCFVECMQVEDSASWWTAASGISFSNLHPPMETVIDALCSWGEKKAEAAGLAQQSFRIAE
ncbi:beta-1,3-galactosyltransferase 1 isoform X3 [Peromyscus californicus insignis]|uniref:beta-1,3-galactosyltransferase 1 isoform X3 n=1 Tax=Peromyscus californicus insignis TaxID=564181 RepID=UPI0022A67D63|nr:beta-1,3-galactosyltransferase 1 isoform X3 [Peromyscus californicus insignis]